MGIARSHASEPLNTIVRENQMCLREAQGEELDIEGRRKISNGSIKKET